MNCLACLAALAHSHTHALVEPFNLVKVYTLIHMANFIHPFIEWNAFFLYSYSGRKRTNST